MIRVEDLNYAIPAAEGAKPVLRGLGFEVPRGRLAALLGPSGCGKSTLLRILAGRQRADSGRVDVEGPAFTIHQESSLFPWLDVHENLHFGSLSGLDPALVARLLRVAGLEGFESHFPHELSGGMRRKAELLRAILSQSPTLLLDEPLASLDALSRHRLRREFKMLLREFPRTVVLVTHDIEDALDWADVIFIASHRPMRILQVIERNANGGLGLDREGLLRVLESSENSNLQEKR